MLTDVTHQVAQDTEKAAFAAAETFVSRLPGVLARNISCSVIHAAAARIAFSSRTRVRARTVRTHVQGLLKGGFNQFKIN